MDHLPAGKVWVDHCYRCGGSFIEGGKASEAVGEFADPSKWQAAAFARPAIPSVLLCPSGHGRMWSHLFRHDKREVEVDTCSACRGLWLDAREAQALAAITLESHHEGTMPGASKGSLGMTVMYIAQLMTLLPVEVNNPVRRKVALIPSLVGINIFMFLGVTFYMAGTGRIEWFFQTFGVVPDDVLHGKNVFSLVTHAFLHGGFMHIAGNLYTLWIFGDNVEDRLGRLRFSILYTAAAIGGGVAYALGHIGQKGVMVGASGAIAGLMGAYIVLFPRVKLWLVVVVPFKLRAYWYMLIWIGLNALLISNPESKTAWEAHFGGLVVGVALAFLLRPRRDVDAPPTLRLPPMGAR